MKVNVKNLRVVKLGVAIHLFVSLVTVGFCFVACAADARVVVDSAGRRVEVPAKIERVFAAGAPAGVFLYTLAPEKLLNWNLPLTAEQRAYMPARFGALPALGRLTGRGNTRERGDCLGRASRCDLRLRHDQSDLYIACRSCPEADRRALSTFRRDFRSGRQDL
jgi:hypothetical protein